MLRMYVCMVAACLVLALVWLWQFSFLQNLLISADGHLKVCDFGTAKILTGDDASSATTAAAGNEDEPPRRKSFVGTWVNNTGWGALLAQHRANRGRFFDMDDLFSPKR